MSKTLKGALIITALIFVLLIIGLIINKADTVKESMIEKDGVATETFRC